MKKLSQETVNKNVDYIVDGIKEVITTFGPRAPGSKGEADAQEYFAKELGKYADEVKTQKFTLHPMAFMGWIYFEVAFMLAALVCLWFNINIASILLGVTAITLAVLQLMLYIHVTAPFFPKKTSSNVYAVKKPTGEVKRRIIFGAPFTKAEPSSSRPSLSRHCLLSPSLSVWLSLVYLLTASPFSPNP